MDRPVDFLIAGILFCVILIGIYFMSKIAYSIGYEEGLRNAVEVIKP